jgi:hypothetical protein
MAAHWMGDERLEQAQLRALAQHGLTRRQRNVSDLQRRLPGGSLTVRDDESGDVLLRLHNATVL